MNIIRKPFKYSFFYVTLVLLAVNLLVFFLCMYFPNLRILLGLNYRTLFEAHFFWTPITYMFVHGSWSHLIFNMIALVCFGLQLERTIGSGEFLVFYFVCGILDGIISVFLYRIFGMNILLIGASGAIYALLLAFAVVYPRSIISIWGIIPVPAPLLVAIYAVIEFVSEIFGRGGIAHLTHLCGFGIAWLYFVVRMGINPARVWKNAWKK